MKNYVYCKTTAKGVQSYYLMADGKRYFLFNQEFRRSNKEVFLNGVMLCDLKKLKKHCSTSVKLTAKKLPSYIKYIEQEYDIKVLEETKQKAIKKPTKKILVERNMHKDMDKYFENLSEDCAFKDLINGNIENINIAI